MATLTIELGDHLFQTAEAYSERVGKSLPELIVDYVSGFGGRNPSSELPRPSLFGTMRGTAEVVGDIVSPLPEEDWKVLRS